MKKRSYDDHQYWKKRYTKQFNQEDNQNLNQKKKEKDNKNENENQTRKRKKIKNTSDIRENDNDEALSDEVDVTNEWYYDWNDISSLLPVRSNSFLESSPVLDIGCGLSSLFYQMIKSGYSGKFVGIDYIQQVIDKQKHILSIKQIQQRQLQHQQQHNENIEFEESSSEILAVQDNVEYLCVDACKLHLNPEFTSPYLNTSRYYGLIIDKATSDGLMCHDKNQQNVKNMYKSIGFLLSPGGYYICCSVISPEDSGWLQELVIPSLQLGDSSYDYQITVHSLEECLYKDGEKEGPNVYLIRKCARERRERELRGETEMSITRKFH